MVNFRIVYKIIGSLLFIEAIFMGWCLAIAFIHHEDDTLAFLLSMLLTFGFTYALTGVSDATGSCSFSLDAMPRTPSAAAMPTS